MSDYSKKNELVAIIPFYNEEALIANVLSETLKYVDSVIAVNDGSTDKSLENIQKFNCSIYLENIENNEGKGRALNIGFLKSIELNSDITVTIDADMQHPPNLIPEFVKKIENYDIVIGNRKKSLSKMPIQRILSNSITSFLLSLKTGVKILDSQCGFRMYRTEILEDILPSSNGFEAESQIIVNAALKGYRIGFIDIPTIYGSEKSKMKPIEAIKGFLRVLFS